MGCVEPLPLINDGVIILTSSEINITVYVHSSTSLCVFDVRHRRSLPYMKVNFTTNRTGSSWKLNQLYYLKSTTFLEENAWTMLNFMFFKVKSRKFTWNILH